MDDLYQSTLGCLGRDRLHHSRGLDQGRLGEDVGQIDGEIVCSERLGGLLNHYYRKAA